MGVNLQSRIFLMEALPAGEKELKLKSFMKSVVE
jgi:hypothetical protein